MPLCIAQRATVCSRLCVIACSDLSNGFRRSTILKSDTMQRGNHEYSNMVASNSGSFFEVNNMWNCALEWQRRKSSVVDLETNRHYRNID